MVSVSANNALGRPGAMVTKKAVIIITLVVWGLAVDVQAAVSGSISEIVMSALPSLNPAVGRDSNFSVAPSNTTLTECLGEATACVSDGDCYDCMEQIDDDGSDAKTSTMIATDYGTGCGARSRGVVLPPLTTKPSSNSSVSARIVVGARFGWEGTQAMS
ncbi:MAG: hypothetical protein ABJX82_08960, partial [Paracoccaceae bacterium]